MTVLRSASLDMRNGSIQNRRAICQSRGPSPRHPTLLECCCRSPQPCGPGPRALLECCCRSPQLCWPGPRAPRWQRRVRSAEIYPWIPAPSAPVAVQAGSAASRPSSGLPGPADRMQSNDLHAARCRSTRARPLAWARKAAMPISTSRTRTKIERLARARRLVRIRSTTRKPCRGLRAFQS